MLLGHRARSEVLKTRFRVSEAMRVQVVQEGRFVGGRPPYGYRLEDAGPHPNPQHAGWGRRRHRLAADPVTAGHVRWMFEQRLAGRSVAEIVAMLNDRRVPAPAEYDRDRNTRRAGEAGWAHRTVAAILANPRYTGWQVWNRQSIRHRDEGARHGDSSRPIRRLNPKSEWVISQQPAHVALISEEMFVGAQAVSARLRPVDGVHRRYLLVGLVTCARCGLRAESQWAHGRAAYRCRHGTRGPRPAGAAVPFYAREDTLLAAAALQLDVRSGLGQTWWDAEDVAAYLRGNKLALRCAPDQITIEGQIVAPRDKGIGDSRQNTNQKNATLSAARAQSRTATPRANNRRVTRRKTLQEMRRTSP